jgi:hypothetical protein
MTSGPVMVSALEGEGAVLLHRQLMGATNPAEADAGTGVCLDHNLVAALDELVGRRVEEGDTMLLGFDFFGNADDHDDPMMTQRPTSGSCFSLD